MTIQFLSRLIELEIWAFLLGMMGIVFYKTLNGGINLDGLLANKTVTLSGETEAGGMSATRLQLLILTITGALGYLGTLPTAEVGTLPDVPPELLLLFGGSASIYIGGKGSSLIRGTLFGSPTNPTPTPHRTAANEPVATDPTNASTKTPANHGVDE